MGCASSNDKKAQEDFLEKVELFNFTDIALEKHNNIMIDYSIHSVPIGIG